jgi:hypothetical protein
MTDPRPVPFNIFLEALARASSVVRMTSPRVGMAKALVLLIG